MARSKRVTFSIDHDIYEWAVERATIRRISLGEQLRWITRDGVSHRLELERQYRELARREAADGR